MWLRLTAQCRVRSTTSTPLYSQHLNTVLRTIPYAGRHFQHSRCMVKAAKTMVNADMGKMDKESHSAYTV